MDNPEKLETQGTQDTGQINVREYRMGSQNRNPKKLETQGKQDTGQINVREYRRGNQKGAIQRNWKHRAHKTKKNRTKTQHNMCWAPLFARIKQNKKHKERK